MNNVATLALAVLAGIAGAQAQTFPSRPITLIVPFAPGAGADISARIAGEYMSRTLGQQFIVRMSSGGRHRGHDAGGASQPRRLHDRARPHGYPRRLGGALSEFAYRPDVDFEPIGLIVDQPIVLVTRKALPAGSLQEFVGLCQGKAAKLKLAHAGVGSVSFTSCLLLNAAIGIKPAAVPFSGRTAMNAIIGGHVTTCATRCSGSCRRCRPTPIRALAIATARRSTALPSVPTSAEGDWRPGEPRRSSACSLPGEHRSRSSTGSARHSTRRSTTRVRASA